MKKTLKGLWLPVLLAMIAACQDSQINSSEEGNPDVVSAKSIKGEWMWIKTQGSGIAGPYERNPTQAGLTEKIQFQSGSKVVISTTVDGHATTETYTYTINKESDKIVISYFNDGEFVRKQFIEKIGNTLMFSNYEGCCDNAYLAQYARQ